MSRKLTLPRNEFDGVTYIEVHRAETLRKLDISSISSKEMLASVVDRYDHYLSLVKEFYDFQTRQNLRIEEEGDDTVWYVRATRYASMQNRALTRKAVKFERLVVDRTNEFAQALTEAYHDVPDENR